MIRKSDVKWWILEARKHPEAAPDIIEGLVERLTELDEQNESLRDQIIHLQQRQPATKTTSAQVQTLQRQVDVLKGMIEGESSTENAIVFLSEQLQAARTSPSRIENLVKRGQTLFTKPTLIDLCALLAARPHDELLLLTNQSRGFRFLLPDIAPLIDETQWPAPIESTLQPGERVTLATVVREPPRLWTTATQRGYVQRFVRAAFDKQVHDSAPVMTSPFRNDPPVAIVDGEQGDIMLLTRWGEAVRFPQRTIDVRGSLATTLDPDDRCVAAVALQPEAIVLIVTTSGQAARYDTSSLSPLAKPGAKSRRIMLARDVMAVLPCSPQSQLLYLTYSGKLFLTPAASIPLQTRAGKGTHLHHTPNDPILAVTLVPEGWL